MVKMFLVGVLLVVGFGIFVALSQGQAVDLGQQINGAIYLVGAVIVLGFLTRLFRG